MDYALFVAIPFLLILILGPIFKYLGTIVATRLFPDHQQALHQSKRKLLL